MADETLVLAILRLDRALTRAENRLAAAPVSATDAPVPTTDVALADRHRTLRAEMAAAADRLDALIAGADA